MCMISQSLQGLVSFNSKGIREANKLQVYQYRYQGKLIISMYNFQSMRYFQFAF